MTETSIARKRKWVRLKINNVNALNSADSFKKCEKLVSQKNIAEYTEKDKIELTYLCVKDNILSDVKVKLLYNVFWWFWLAENHH